MVPRLFFLDERDIPEKLRPLLAVNTEHVTNLSLYITSHQDDYVLPPLVATIDMPVSFFPVSETRREIGELRIPMQARLVLQDGQHRRAAIQRLLSGEMYDLLQDTITFLLVVDKGLKRSPELYGHLHRERPRFTKSQQILTDQENPLAALVRRMVHEVPLFDNLTELQRTTISNRSTALFTLNAVHQATQALLGKTKDAGVTADQQYLARMFWTALGEIIPEWCMVIHGEISAAELRRRYVHAHAVTLLAIGRAGHTLVTRYPDSWRQRLQLLDDMDWSRENTQLWEGRAMVHGKMSKSRDSIRLTTNVIKRALDLELSEEEQELERRLNP
jgi:DNA sulfur modification protein DndB